MKDRAVEFEVRHYSEQPSHQGRGIFGRWQAHLNRYFPELYARQPFPVQIESDFINRRKTLRDPRSGR